MGALGSASITYSIKNARRMGNSKVQNRVSLTFGDGSSTYPTGGIAVLGGQCGCPNTIESMVVADAGSSGYTANYNSVTGKIQLYQAGSHSHPLIVASNAGTAGTQAMNATTALGVFNSGAAVTVAAQAGTLGGISANVAGIDSEIPSSTTPASMTLIFEVIGW
jgi:hypothetical protein